MTGLRHKGRAVRRSTALLSANRGAPLLNVFCFARGSGKKIFQEKQIWLYKF
jgi:hypothetical protein